MVHRIESRSQIKKHQSTNFTRVDFSHDKVMHCKVCNDGGLGRVIYHSTQTPDLVSPTSRNYMVKHAYKLRYIMLYPLPVTCRHPGFTILHCIHAAVLIILVYLCYKLDHENMAVTVVDALLSCVPAEFCVIAFSESPSWISEFSSLTSFLLSC